MQQQNKRRPLILIGTVLLAIAAVLGCTWLLRLHHARLVAAQEAACSEAARVQEVARRAQLAALEQKLQELDQTYSEVMQKYALLQQQLLASRHDALTREVAEARRAVDVALDQHPALLALQQQLPQSIEADATFSHQQAEILTTLHALQAQRREADNQALNDIATRETAARQAFLAGLGKPNLAHLTPEEAQQWGTLQAPFARQAQAALVAWTNRPPEQAEQQLTKDFKDLGQQREAVNTHYSAVYKDLPAMRGQVRADDPAIAALDRVLAEKQARLLAAVDAAPELVTLKQQLLAMRRERTALFAQLRVLRRGALAAPAKPTAKLPLTAACTNG